MMELVLTGVSVTWVERTGSFLLYSMDTNYLIMNLTYGEIEIIFQ